MNGSRPRKRLGQRYGPDIFVEPSRRNAAVAALWRAPNTRSSRMGPGHLRPLKITGKSIRWGTRDAQIDREEGDWQE